MSRSIIAYCPVCTQDTIATDGYFVAHASLNERDCPASEEPVDAVAGLVGAVRMLHARDARHKRGWRLSERTATDALLHAIEELTEVGRARNDYGRVSELGDALACLANYVVLSEVDLDAAARSALRKLAYDFPEDTDG